MDLNSSSAWDFSCSSNEAPVGNDGDMVVGGPGWAQGPLVGNEAGEPEDLSGDESALAAAVGSLDHVAHLADGEFDVLEAHAGLELEGVEEHLGSVGDGNRIEHGILRKNGGRGNSY